MSEFVVISKHKREVKQIAGMMCFRNKIIEIVDIIPLEESDLGKGKDGSIKVESSTLNPKDNKEIRHSMLSALKERSKNETYHPLRTEYEELYRETMVYIREKRLSTLLD